MAQFRKWIKSENEKFEFWFTEILEINSTRFFVTVVDSSRNLVTFSMIRNAHENWKIFRTGNEPEWIFDLEELLSACIEESYPNAKKSKDRI